MESYTGRDDAFFYSLVYDPHNKSLVADRGEIRIGSSYQVNYFYERARCATLVSGRHLSSCHLAHGSIWRPERHGFIGNRGH